MRKDYPSVDVRNMRGRTVRRVTRGPLRSPYGKKTAALLPPRQTCGELVVQAML